MIKIVGLCVFENSERLLWIEHIGVQRLNCGRRGRHMETLRITAPLKFRRALSFHQFAQDFLPTSCFACKRLFCRRLGVIPVSLGRLNPAAGVWVVSAQTDPIFSVLNTIHGYLKLQISQEVNDIKNQCCLRSRALSPRASQLRCTKGISASWGQRDFGSAAWDISDLLRWQDSPSPKRRQPCAAWAPEDEEFSCSSCVQLCSSDLVGGYVLIFHDIPLPWQHMATRRDISPESLVVAFAHAGSLLGSLLLTGHGIMFHCTDWIAADSDLAGRVARSRSAWGNPKLWWLEVVWQKMRIWTLPYHLGWLVVSSTVLLILSGIP